MKPPQAELTDEEVLEAMQVRGALSTLLLAAGKGLTGEPLQYRTPPNAFHLFTHPSLIAENN